MRFWLLLIKVLGNVESIESTPRSATKQLHSTLAFGVSTPKRTLSDTERYGNGPGISAMVGFTE